MIFKNRIGKFVISILLLLSLLGCTGDSSREIKKRAVELPKLSQMDPNGTLVLALGGEVSILNPILSTDTTSSAVEGTIFSGMIRFNKHLEPEPDLATHWKVSKDGKVWTFYLKKNVFWQDGHPFTAADVKFTFDSILNPKVNTVRRSNYIIDGVPIKFRVVDKYTVQAILPKPYAPFIVHAAMSIIPKHLLAGKDINRAEFNRNPIGTGPFKLADWQVGNHVIVERNENYFGKKPCLKKIIYKIIPDENARLVALEAGEIDSAGVPPKDYKRMWTIPSVNIFEYDVLLYVYLGFNLANPIFRDVTVRQAFAHATNKDQLISLVLKGLGSRADVPNAPVSWAYADDVVKYKYDLKKANALLDQAGWKLNSDGIREKNGKKLAFTIIINQGNKEREKAAIILQQQYKKIGAKVKIRVLEWSALLRIVNAPKGPKNFDAVIMGWSLGLDPDGYIIWHSSQYPRGFNFIDYKNKKVDHWLEVGRTELNRKKRKATYAKIYQEIAKDVPYIFLWYPRAVSAISKRVGGLDPNPGPAGAFLDIEDVFVIK
ncbi:MAG: peptide-binding protein [Candidatus Margulisbacteria bacterium]|nr:peptide-binding protein [Candidatus Margulisiibacteriota bacterium]MBU1729872.1 peptide-binding protein [Candidatus Margulisiibacteriota bacterium]MBU1955202.1 peptide-binding protein [Candidatus Margulisiibacteriota bacterium]